MKSAFRLSLPHYSDEEEEDEDSAEAAVEIGESQDDDQGEAEEDFDECMGGIEVEIEVDGEFQEDDLGFVEIEMELRNVFTSGRITPPGMLTSYSISSPLHSSCLAHTLQLVVKDGVAALGAIPKEAIKKVSRGVSSIRKSTLDSEILDKSVKFRIPPTNAIRWNSQLKTLVKFTEAMEKDPTLSEKLNAFKVNRGANRVSALDMKAINELISILRPLQLATDDLQTDHETLGKAIPAFLDLKTKIAAFANPSSNLLQRNGDNLERVIKTPT